MDSVDGARSQGEYGGERWTTGVCARRVARRQDEERNRVEEKGRMEEKKR